MRFKKKTYVLFNYTIIEFRGTKEGLEYREKLKGVKATFGKKYLTYLLLSRIKLGAVKKLSSKYSFLVIIGKGQKNLYFSI